jgi:enoyl-CoA hydratase/carnithine racemase
VFDDLAILHHVDRRLRHSVVADAAVRNIASAGDQEAENMVRSARTTDHKEAVRAFIDKRKPAFVGH